jgi:hypothetical protein
MDALLGMMMLSKINLKSSRTGILPCAQVILSSAAVALLLAGSIALSPMAVTAVPLPRSVPCPPAAKAQLEGFYRWFLASNDGRSQFQSQRHRFTAELYEELRAGFALQPADGRFVDFDPFSNTQVTSYGHRIAGCRLDANGSLVMRVQVLAGLAPSRASYQPLDYVLTASGGDWRIADIRYPGEVSFSLREYLQRLLKQP